MEFAPSLDIILNETLPAMMKVQFMCKWIDEVPNIKILF
jgi:hypothetical protein